MATPYFDPTDSTHVALLPQAFRGDADLVVQAGEVEAEIIGYFTEQPGYWPRMVGEERIDAGYWGLPRNNGEDVTDNVTTSPVTLRVYLRGYKADASDPAVDANLKAALRRTVALVLTWRLSQRKLTDPGLLYTSDAGANSRSYRATAEDAFPADWDRYLLPFKTGRTLWGW